MPPKVTLQVVPEDPRQEAVSFGFTERSCCLVGRSKDCHVHIPDRTRVISRHHCLLDINPPQIRIRDFGSQNGTLVNGIRIGGRSSGQSAEEGRKESENFPEVDLKDGDEISLAGTLLRVSIHAPAECLDCGVEIDSATPSDAMEMLLCAACRAKLSADTALSESSPKVCSRCGKPLSRAFKELLDRDHACLICQQDPEYIVTRVLADARSGTESLLSIEGYRVVQELGRGGMGAVYLAEHPHNHETVAIKIMLPRAAARKDAVERFLLETELTKALEHSNIVRCLDSGYARRAFYLVLEYCEAGSVADLMHRFEGKLPMDLACNIFFQMVDGLEYAHDRFVNLRLPNGTVRSSRPIHRDLKPANLFLKSHGKDTIVKIGDFGMAKGFDTAGLSGLTRTGSLAGTPAFMPRQQVINLKYAKPDVDIWAAAATLYNMLTGCYPRDFPPHQDPWCAILQSKPVPIRKRLPSLPQAFAEVIDLALDDSETLYFQNATELRTAIKQTL